MNRNVSRYLLLIVFIMLQFIVNAQDVAVQINTNTGDTIICQGGELTLTIEGCNSYSSTSLVEVGDIYCTDSMIIKSQNFLGSGKTAEGVVCWVSADNTQVWLISLHDQGLVTFATGTADGVNLPIPDVPLPPVAGTFLDGELYTQQIRNAGNAVVYPAAWTVDYQNNWYIPSITQWSLMFPNVDAINVGLQTVGGDLLDKSVQTSGLVGYPSTMYLASSEIITPIGGPDYDRIWNFAFDELGPHYIGNYKSNAFYETPYTLRAAKNASAITPCKIIWTWNDNIDSISKCAIDVNPMVTTTYTVNIYCGDDIYSGEKTIVVENPAEIDIVANPTDTTRCIGEQFSLSLNENSLSNPAEINGVAYWSWNNDTAVGKIIYQTATETTTYFLSYSYGNNCVSKTSKTIIVTAIQGENSSFNLCNGDSVLLSSLEGSQQYIWSPIQDINNEENEAFVFPNVSTKYFSNYKINTNCYSDTFNINVNNSSQHIIYDTVCVENLPYSKNGLYAEVAGEYFTMLTNAAGCDSLLTLRLSVENPKDVNISNASGEMYVCEGDNVVLSLATESMFDRIVWTWQPDGETINNNILRHFPLQNTQYYVNAFSDRGCLSIDSFYVEVRPLPTIEIMFDQTAYCDSGFATIIATGNSQNYMWNNGEPTSDIKIIYPGIFTVVGELDECVAEQNITVDKCNHAVYIPSAFTPDNDGINDVFAPKSIALETMKMYIYDRWGHLLFFTENIEDSWDGFFNGEICPQGIYTYYVIYTTIDRPGYDIHRYGFVSLIK